MQGDMLVRGFGLRCADFKLWHSFLHRRTQPSSKNAILKDEKNQIITPPSSEFIPEKEESSSETDIIPLMVVNLPVVIQSGGKYPYIEAILDGKYDTVPDIIPICFYGDFQLM
ncbi:MAG: hypothetical protein EZS28_029845 [Streblomastix strix]|uniref:Uncharacterized protein n=1 Tax=Streblomastix strix TaxID=222440 RepID=A0A5J4UW03_9EUKA|nr:MAG: hypothetical protein EZS28_029845 [Streblomastix strix]